MRVLVVSVPQAGHLTPMLPLVTALVQAGDEVTIATADDVREAAVATGARFETAGHGMGTWFGSLAARTRGAPGDGLPPERIAYYFLPRLFGEIAAADMIDDLVEIGRSIDPDLVMFDAQAYAGPLAATLLDAHPVQHTIGPVPEPDVLDLVADAVSPLWRSFGHDVPRHAGVYSGTTVALCPPSLGAQPFGTASVLPLRPAPPPRQAPAPTQPPTVYVTFGTQWANQALLRVAVDALAELPVRVVMTTGAVDPAALGAAPESMRVERFVPQAELLPEVSLVVHHGGSGTMFGAFAHGLPQVVLPQAADNFVNADAVAAAGAGRTLRPDALSAEALRAAVQDVLQQASYAETAAAVAAEIAAMPAPEQVVERLHALR